MKIPRSEVERVRQYYQALTEIIHADYHDYFVEPNGIACVNMRQQRVPRPSTPRLKVALERELQLVSAWLSLHK
jgi:hypothetical protein